jgi:calpain family cysteine protease/hemolysin type calcium-binding protein
VSASTRLTRPLGFETLEAREVPSVTVQELPDGIHVTAGNGGSVVTVSRPSIVNGLTITDNMTGQKWTFEQGPLDFTRVIFIGGDGKDQCYATNAFTPVSLHGGKGVDVLVGGYMKDYIDGGAGADVLRGGGGNDTIYGRTGFDKLYGEGGCDFLDDGNDTPQWISQGGLFVQLADFTDGGPSGDFIARKPVFNGIKPDDIDQAGTPTCWVLAPMAAAAKAGIKLGDRITYIGNGDYQVKLLNDRGGHSIETVNLEGGRLSFEPVPHGDESWVILFHRAIMQARGVDWTNEDAYSGGFEDQIMPYLTGRPAIALGSPALLGLGYFGLSHVQQMHDALAENKIVCVGTRPGNYGTWDIGGSVTTSKLVGGHAYAVVSVNMVHHQIVLRNPWGVDGGKYHNAWVDGKWTKVPADGVDDGLVTINFDDFYGSFHHLSIS